MPDPEHPKSEAKDDVLEAVELTEPKGVDAGPEDAEVIETVPEPETDRSAAPAAVPSQPTTPSQVRETKSSSGFAGMVLGGAIAAAAGYALATYMPMVGMSDVDGRLSAQDAALNQLSERVSAIEVAPRTDPDLAERLAALETAAPPQMPDLSAVTESLSRIEARVTALENMPSSDGSAAPAALVGAVDALRAEVESLKGAGATATAEIEAMAAQAQERLAEAEAQAAQLKAEAEDTARKAMERAAISRLQASLESGAPYAAVLTDLAGHDVPAILTESAETGLPSQSALEEAFPSAAREALDASLKATMGDSWTDRMTTFLQSTTGARSLSPREGNDPDAILSRAEAAVKARDLSAALTELQALPAEGQAAMAEFVAMAQKRLDAEVAVAALSADVEG